MAKDRKLTDKQIAYKHKMMKKMVDDKYAHAIEKQSSAIRQTADRWKEKMIKSVRTFKYKRARTRRQTKRVERRESLRAKLEAIDDESEDDPLVSDDSSDYDIFGYIHEDSNPSDDDDEDFEPPGAGVPGVLAD